MRVAVRTRTAQVSLHFRRGHPAAYGTSTAPTPKGHGPLTTSKGMMVGILRKTLLATTLLGAGLSGTAGIALADQAGAANVDDVQTTVPASACNNDVPVNVLGVQVPIQDVAGNVPLLSGADHGGSASGVAKTCGNGVKADN